MIKKDLSSALKAGFPVFIGYFPVALAFGMLSKGSGISLLECFLFSAVVFAGASQFIALNLLMTGTGPGGVILTTLLVNFRHFLMSASLATRVKQFAQRFHFLIAFGITDEVFSVLSFKQGNLSKTFIFVLESAAYTCWISGTLSGYILGGFLPEILIKSMGVALYSLLLAILLPELKQSMRSLVLAISAGVLNTVLVTLDVLPRGWSIIVCIVIIASIGAFFAEPREKEQRISYG